jgi:hypothetical protein
MERKPARQEHDFDWHDRHAAPWDLAVEGQLDAGEDVGALGAAGGQDRFAGAGHMGGVSVLAHHLEREIGLYAG